MTLMIGYWQVCIYVVYAFFGSKTDLVRNGPLLASVLYGSVAGVSLVALSASTRIRVAEFEALLVAWAVALVSGVIHHLAFRKLRPIARPERPTVAVGFAALVPLGCLVGLLSSVAWIIRS